MVDVFGTKTLPLSQLVEEPVIFSLISTRSYKAPSRRLSAGRRMRLTNFAVGAHRNPPFLMDGCSLRQNRRARKRWETKPTICATTISLLKLGSR